MWAPLEEQDLAEGGGEHVYPARVIDAPDDVLWAPDEASTNVLTGAELGYCIQVWYDDDFLQKYQRDKPGCACCYSGPGSCDMAWADDGVLCESSKACPKIRSRTNA